MESKDRRLAPRYSFVADIEVTDVQSGAQIRGRVKDLSLSGCGVSKCDGLREGNGGQD